MGTNCDKLRDFVNTQSHPSDVQNSEDEKIVKNIVKYLELIGILTPIHLSLILTV